MTSAYRDLLALLRTVWAWCVCEAHLQHGPRPVLQACAGARAHACGDRLRAWMGIDNATFYDAEQIALIPMGLCYPGRGAGGDLPLRLECAPLWMDALLAKLPRVELTLMIGLYAQRYFLGTRRQTTLTETLRQWQDCGPKFLPLPHSSPRNTPWFKAHPWIERELLPTLRSRVRQLLRD